MPAIGDQVATLEHDHAEALSKIDSQNSTIEALTLALADMTKAKLALESDIADLHKHADDTLAMVESVANNALEMLRMAGKRPVVAAEKIVAKVSAFAPKVIAGVEKALDIAPKIEPLAQIPLVTADTIAKAALAQAAPEQPVTPGAAGITDKLLHDVSDAGTIFKGFEQTIVKDANAAKTAISNVPEAVERMLHHSSAASTLIRRPIDITTYVEHDEGGLPMFLRRGTAFEAMTRR